MGVGVPPFDLPPAGVDAGRKAIAVGGDQPNGGLRPAERHEVAAVARVLVGGDDRPGGTESLPPVPVEDGLPQGHDAVVDEDREMRIALLEVRRHETGEAPVGGVGEAGVARGAPR